MHAVSGADDAATNAMPGNPEAELPDTIASNIPDNAEVVSEDHALTADGTLKDLATGKTVTDPELVGTQSSQPDPLAKTDGESFIPVEAGTVKTKIEDASKQQGSTDTSAETSNGKAAVRLASLPNNDYGAYWGTYNGTPAFFESNGNLFVQQAKGVIDVSEWQGDIDWAKAKSAGVEGAIIRISYGWGNGYDKKALRNISECKRLGIPFGIYMYSYAENSGNAASEGADVASLLRKAGVNPGDLKYPVYYDLEAWSWTGHAHPTSPSVYDGIVNAWFNQLRNAGYGNLAVYSYTSYLNNELNSNNIHAKTRWVAQYSSRMGYTAWSSNARGWQYSSSAHINGISGSVDVNAFGNYTHAAETRFVDVNSETPHADDIKWLADKGIAEGWSDGTFRGMDSVKRQDMAAFLYRLAGSPEYTPGSAVEKRFVDVDGRTPHAKEIWWLADKGIAEGWSDGTFRGMDSVKRQDMAAFLHRFALARF